MLSTEVQNAQWTITGWGSGFRKKKPCGHRPKKNGVLCGAEACGKTEMPGVRSEGEDQRMEKWLHKDREGPLCSLSLGIERPAGLL